jgi:hypothetical protein
MNDRKEKSQSPITGSDATRPASVSRRALLRSGVVAMPAILTLHSGAALARSSNMISAAPSGTTDGMGRTLCVDKSSVVYADADGSSEIFDLGEPPSAEMNIIRGPTEVQYFESENSSTPIAADAMCERGGVFSWKPEGGNKWESKQLNQGFVTSVGAWTSIAGFVKDSLY